VDEQRRPHRRGNRRAHPARTFGSIDFVKATNGPNRRGY
jgi:hypothetical protein